MITISLVFPLIKKYEGPLMPSDLMRDYLQIGVHHSLFMNLMTVMRTRRKTNIDNLQVDYHCSHHNPKPRGPFSTRLLSTD